MQESTVSGTFASSLAAVARYALVMFFMVAGLVAAAYNFRNGHQDQGWPVIAAVIIFGVALEPGLRKELPWMKGRRVNRSHGNLGANIRVTKLG